MINKHRGKERLGGIGKTDKVPYCSAPELGVGPEMGRDEDCHEVFYVEEGEGD
jgi:hypothetical protein